MTFISIGAPLLILIGCFATLVTFGAPLTGTSVSALPYTQFRPGTARRRLQQRGSSLPVATYPLLPN
jgi:hypothetical protein